MCEAEKSNIMLYAVGDASVLDLCENDTEEDMLRLWSFPNDADEEG